MSPCLAIESSSLSITRLDREEPSLKLDLTDTLLTMARMRACSIRTQQPYLLLACAVTHMQIMVHLLHMSHMVTTINPKSGYIDL